MNEYQGTPEQEVEHRKYREAVLENKEMSGLLYFAAGTGALGELVDLRVKVAGEGVVSKATLHHLQHSVLELVEFLTEVFKECARPETATNMVGVIDELKAITAELRSRMEDDDA